MAANKFAEIGKLVEQLHDKYKNYTSFSFTKDTTRGIAYEKWNVYTPRISHNEFPTAQQLKGFLKKMLRSKKAYTQHRPERLREDLKELQERKHNIEEEIKYIESGLIEISKEKI